MHPKIGVHIYLYVCLYLFIFFYVFCVCRDIITRFQLIHISTISFYKLWNCENFTTKGDSCDAGVFEVGHFVVVDVVDDFYHFGDVGVLLAIALIITDRAIVWIGFCIVADFLVIIRRCAVYYVIYCDFPLF